MQKDLQRMCDVGYDNFVIMATLLRDNVLINFCNIYKHNP